MSRFFLGVDAGATKTHALVMTDEGHVQGMGNSGSGNHESYGFAHARVSISAAVESALQVSGIVVSDLEQACFCLAGADVSQDYKSIPQHILEPLCAGLNYSLKNDSFGCLRGGTRDPFGIMVNCGTGQVAVGRNRDGQEVRIGGYGFDFGDFAGGGVITQSAVAAVVRAADGRGKPTRLTELLLSETGEPDVAALIDRTYRDPAYLASLRIPALTFQAAAAGDAVARRIILAVADEMGVTATALIDRLGMQDDEFDLITAGSVFKGEDPVFLETIRHMVHSVAPGARFCFPAYAPVVGAVLLAYQEAGNDVSDDMYANLELTMPRELQE